ncbi:hypothetical protein K2173_014659 [Erythroxylum novogranatense]|uniref:Vomeronasal type-1 receptor n=1 Tax=Erythroxylum novogranatense TaxID=1862640 RepID=A0AAV8TF95_9ROSI|nr:hypothetical protein K2173_014659 [Erythroxylum novogranatense]
MGVLVKSSGWEPNPSIYLFIFLGCFFSSSLLPRLSKDSIFLSASSFLHFNQKSVVSWLVFGEFELVHYSTRLIGHKITCLVFCIPQLVVGLWKKIVPHPGVWLASVCLSCAMSNLSFSFKDWVVIENDKVLANWMAGNILETGATSPSTATMILATLGIISLSKGRKEATQTISSKDYRISYALLFSDIRMWLLGLAHASVQFSIAVFWILWASTLVVGSLVQVNLGLMYPCSLAQKLVHHHLARMEDSPVYTFVILGFVLSIVAYDYQEIGFLVCLFHAGFGLITAMLARLRTMHVPNELRGRMKNSIQQTRYCRGKQPCQDWHKL